MFPVFRTVLFCLQLSVFLGKDLILEAPLFPLGSDLNSIPFAKNKGKAKPVSIFLFIFTWCWTVIMICAWQGSIHWCELHYLRDGSRIEKAYIEKGRSGVNNSWQVLCQWGHQIGTETSFLCFHPSQCHRLEGDAFSVSAVRLLNVMRSALALADMLCQLSGSYGMSRGIWHPLPLYVMIVGIPTSSAWVPASNIGPDTALLYPRLICDRFTKSVCK